MNKAEEIKWEVHDLTYSLAARPILRTDEGTNLDRIYLFLPFPYRISIIVKFCPFKKRASILSWNISCIAHPEVFPPILFLPLHNSEYCGNATFTSWCVLGM